MEPTQEQIKKFWERCGFVRGSWSGWFEPKEYGGNYIPDNLLKLDLNNLFKYAMPKLPYILVADFAEGAWCWFIRGCDGAPDMSEGCDEDPALALFWAIYKVIDGD